MMARTLEELLPAIVHSDNLNPIPLFSILHVFTEAIPDAQICSRRSYREGRCSRPGIHAIWRCHSRHTEQYRPGCRFTKYEVDFGNQMIGTFYETQLRLVKPSN